MLYAPYHGRFRRNREAFAAGAFIGYVHQHRAVGGAWYIAVAYRGGGFVFDPLLLFCMPHPEGDADFAAEEYDHVFCVGAMFHCCKRWVLFLGVKRAACPWGALRGHSSRRDGVLTGCRLADDIVLQRCRVIVLG